MPEDQVLDDEVLYRRVPDREGNYERDKGSYILLPAAFLDRAKQPSVDRAKLRDNDPTKCILEPTDFVVSLVAIEVRRIDDLSRTVDVVPDPIKDDPQLPDNPAHALITAALPKKRKDGLQEAANSIVEASQLQVGNFARLTPPSDSFVVEERAVEDFATAQPRTSRTGKARPATVPEFNSSSGP